MKKEKKSQIKNPPGITQDVPLVQALNINKYPVFHQVPSPREGMHLGQLT